MEHDPLVRDAVEGLKYTGAVDAARSLDHMRPAAPRGVQNAWWIGGGTAVILAVVGTAYFISSSEPEKQIAESTTPRIEGSTITDHDGAPLANAEILAAVEQPRPERIGHERMALHTREAARLAVPRETTIERVDPRKTDLSSTTSPTSVRSAGRSHTNRQLLFLHDLKLVHPKELYGNDPALELSDEHVAARFADAARRDSLRAQDVLLSYTEFMDEALYRFSNNDHKGCLDDLRFVLSQYPDDVNALFYAGLCSYNLGLYERARTFLQRAATHPVNVFDEEASWYHALTLDRMDDPGSIAAYQRVANGGGFYSELAKARVAPR